MREFRPPGVNGFAERGAEAAGQCGGCLDCNLLTKNGAHRHFESIERAGHAEAGISLQQRRQPNIVLQMSDNHIRPRVEIEQMT